ncbi:sugar nucleotide-binding protein, partial [bacterium]|nr:sugar nucleotide-binding protein [bacterium]
PRPIDIYEVTKLEGEELALKEAESGFPAVIVRPGWVYGPGDSRTLKLFRMIARKRFLMIGKAPNKQHPVFITDLVEGIIRSAEIVGVEGRVYHLCGPEVMTVNDLCETVAEATGVKLFPFRPPLWAVRWPAWLIGKLFGLWGGDPPVDQRKADFFVINRAYSIRRAKEELGWVPGVKFKNGIKQTVEWYRQQKLL